MRKKIKPLNPGQIYCSPRQAAAIMGVAESVIYTAHHRGQIPGSRQLGERRILIPVSWVIGGGGQTL